MEPIVNTEVLIVGAGPTGLSLAAQFHRYGIPFHIVDEKDGPTKLSKAVVVQARSIEIFRELGLGGEALSHGKVTNALNFYYKGKKRAHLDLSQMGKGLSAYPFVLSLEQSKTERLLADHLAGHGTRIDWNTAFESFIQDAGGISATLRGASGRYSVRASYLVGCDGASSPIRHAAGLGFQGDTVPKIFYVADVSLTSPVICKDEVFVFLIPKGFVVFFPMDGAGHYRMIGILPDVAPDQVENLTFDDVKKSLAGQLSIEVRYDDLHWFSHYKVHSRKADSFSEGRVFLAGDAAHIHSPAGGQGMNTGIQDAYNLAWKLALVLKGAAGARILDSYSFEREANARKLLHTTDAIFDYMAGTTGLRNFVRLHIFPHIAHFIGKTRIANRFLFPFVSQIGIAYPESPLTVKSRVGNVCAGDRMPYFRLPDGRDIFDVISEPGFKLLYFGVNAPPDPPFPLITMPDVPEKWFGKAREFYLLLRPDNHISYLGPDRNAVARFLQKLKN
jgi:2-polyprenyl-6-methoxyphenol hydroxylase-like FAD-dependent oxidoreductase